MPDGVICIETIAKRDHFQTLSVRRKSCSSPLDLHKHSVFQTGNVGRFETTAMDNRVKLLHYQSLPSLHQTSERTFTTFISQRLLCRNLTTTPQINTTKANSKFIRVFRHSLIHSLAAANHLLQCIVRHLLYTSFYIKLFSFAGYG